MGHVWNAEIQYFVHIIMYKIYRLLSWELSPQSLLCVLEVVLFSGLYSVARWDLTISSSLALNFSIGPKHV